MILEDTCQNPNSGKTFFDISINTHQIGIWFEADTLEKCGNMSIFSNFQTKIWLKNVVMSNRIFRLLINNFLTRSLSESCIQWLLAVILPHKPYYRHLRKCKHTIKYSRCAFIKICYVGIIW